MRVSRRGGYFGIVIAIVLAIVFRRMPHGGPGWVSHRVVTLAILGVVLLRVGGVQIFRNDPDDRR